MTAPTRDLRVDVVVRGVGRLNKTTGARTRDEYRKRVAFVRKLRDTARLDILRAIHSGHLSISEAYSADLSGRLDYTAASVVLTRPLWAALEEWIPRSAPAVESQNR